LRIRSLLPWRMSTDRCLGRDGEREADFLRVGCERGKLKEERVEFVLR